MGGIRKLPRVAGIEGTRKKNTMMIPCMVNSLLYVSCPKTPWGTSKLMRIPTAKRPPRKKNAVIEKRYNSAILL